MTLTEDLKERLFSQPEQVLDYLAKEETAQTERIQNQISDLQENIQEISDQRERLEKCLKSLEKKRE